jgi:hypothetical protein
MKRYFCFSSQAKTNLAFFMERKHVLCNVKIPRNNMINTPFFGGSGVLCVEDGAREGRVDRVGGGVESTKACAAKMNGVGMEAAHGILMRRFRSCLQSRPLYTSATAGGGVSSAGAGVFPGETGCGCGCSGCEDSQSE